MPGGSRLLWAFSSSFLFLLAVAASAGDKSQASKTISAPTPLAPPEAEIKPIAEIFHGTRVVDNYRWLEDSSSPKTQKWVAEEMAYTRSLLDPRPGREAIHKRLSELLSIGSITPPQIAGNQQSDQ